MCLGVPGRIISLCEGELRTGKVDFGGVSKDVCLAFVPEAQIGDHVIVHVGFAISRIDEEQARTTLEYLDRMGELAELRRPAAP